MGDGGAQGWGVMLRHSNGGALAAGDNAAEVLESSGDSHHWGDGERLWCLAAGGKLALSSSCKDVMLIEGAWEAPKFLSQG